MSLLFRIIHISVVRWTTHCKICVLSCALYHTIAEFGNGLIIHSIYFQDHNILTFMQHSLLRIFFLFLGSFRVWNYFFSGRSDILGTVIWIIRLAWWVPDLSSLFFASKQLSRCPCATSVGNRFKLHWTILPVGHLRRSRIPNNSKHLLN